MNQAVLRFMWHSSTNDVAMREGCEANMTGLRERKREREKEREREREIDR